MRCLTIFAGMALLVSCSQELPPEPVSCGVPVTFRAAGLAAGAATRAAAGVGRLDVFVFRSGSFLDVHAVSDTTVTAQVTAGVPLDYCLVRNLPRGLADGVMTLDALEGRLCTLESQANGLTAVAVRRGVIFRERTEVRDTVTRLVSRVTLETVTSELAEDDVQLLRAYITNAVGAVRLSGEVRDYGYWHNRMGCEADKSTGLAGLLDCTLRETLVREQPVKTDASFIMLPNPVTGEVYYGTDPVWTPRPSRLVLEVSVDHELQYYAITLPVLPRNCNLYITDLTIFGYGAEHPDIPVDKMSVAFSAEITPWKAKDVEVDFRLKD